MSPPRTITSPCWIFLAPPINPMSDDLPTPSGPIRPTMRPGGMSMVMRSRATVPPYWWVTALTDATGSDGLDIADTWDSERNMGQDPGIVGLSGGLSLRLGDDGLARGDRNDVLERVRPGNGIVVPHVANAPDPRLDAIDIRHHQLRRHLDLDPEHQLVPLASGLDLFGGELGLGRDERDLRRGHPIGRGVEDDPGLVTVLDPGRLLGRQVQIHVDVHQVEQREHLTTRREHLPLLGQAVQNPPLHWRLEDGIVDPRLGSPHLRLVDLDRLDGGVELGLLFIERRPRGVDRGLLLVIFLPGD